MQMLLQDLRYGARMLLMRPGFTLVVSLTVLLFFPVPKTLSQTVAGSALPNQTEAEKWREDLRFMAEEMPKRHKNLFHTMTREQFAGAVKTLHERIPRLARHQIIVEMARIVALVGDGHTNIAPARDPKIGFRTYPLELYYFKDGLFVRAATRDHADVVGARVLKIGAAPVEQAYAAVREIIGRDNEMDVKFFAPLLLVMPEVLHALGLIADMETAQFVVENQGQQKVVNLKPLGLAEMMARDTDASWRAKENWVDARDRASAPPPLWLKDPLNKFWFEYLPDARTVYVQFNEVGNKETETVEAFSQRLFAFVEANPVDRLALDLRLNRGGNGEFNRPLLRGIIRSAKIDQKSKLFTLIGRSTWSAAQFLVNEMEKYTNTIFVGEPTGGKINSYGDSTRITLPNSGITVRVSTLWWQGDERDRRPWTAPRLAAELTSEQYRNNFDPALTAALSYHPEQELVPLLMEAIRARNQALAVKRAQEFRNDAVNAYVNIEAQLLRQGYQFLSGNQLDDAIEFFKLNVALFPNSWNAYDSLGEAYLKKGDKELAIRQYEQALKLNPGNSNTVEALKRLRGN